MLNDMAANSNYTFAALSRSGILFNYYLVYFYVIIYTQLLSVMLWSDEMQVTRIETSFARKLVRFFLF